MSGIPRLVVSAPSSGHGKTAVSVGLLAALAARGYRAAGFKVGPDHVDAAYLGLAAGRPGRNLDPRMVGADRIGPLFAHGAAALDIAVVEGTMGLFDGLAGRTDAESTAQISGLLRAPVILVIDVGAMGQSVAALVHGFRAYDELLWLGGVVLNRVASGRHEQLLREALDDIGVPVFGALHRRALAAVGEPGVPMPSRHHGVAPVVHGNIDAQRAVRRLGEIVGKAVDLERLMALARSAPRLSASPWSPSEEILAGAPTGEVNAIAGRVQQGGRPLVAVGYAYPETSELLRAAGVDVVPFDPLREEMLPSGVDGLVIGAALPEAYAEDLSANGRLRGAVVAHAAAGRPIAAEGTGLVWLTEDFNGRPMCGVLPARARSAELLVLGYREATSAAASVLLPPNVPVVGHKIHNTVVVPRAGAQPAWRWAGGPPEGFVTASIHASYLGLHWAGQPEIAARFAKATAAARTTGTRPAPGPTQPGPASHVTAALPAAQVTPALPVAASDDADESITATLPVAEPSSTEPAATSDSQPKQAQPASAPLSPVPLSPAGG